MNSDKEVNNFILGAVLHKKISSGKYLKKKLEMVYRLQKFIYGITRIESEQRKTL